MTMSRYQESSARLRHSLLPPVLCRRSGSSRLRHRSTVSRRQADYPTVMRLVHQRTPELCFAEISPAAELTRLTVVIKVTELRTVQNLAPPLVHLQPGIV